VVGRGHEIKILLAVKGHRPRGPAGTGIHGFLDLVRHLVVAQIHEACAIVVHNVLQRVLLTEDLHLVGEDAEHGALPGLLQRHDLEQPLVRLLEVLDFDQVRLHQRGAEQAVRAHDEGPVFGGHRED
jgi:hypothetical protein